MPRPRAGFIPAKDKLGARNSAKAAKAVKSAEVPVAARRSEYLTPTEVADRLLVARVTVRLWATKGLLPSVTTLGGHRRFLARDVDAFVAQHQRATAKASGERPSHVLIIDDSRQFSRYLKRVITSHAPRAVVEIANDGFSAGVKCESIRPDIVTLDLQMPDMDGFEVCAMLRGRFGKAKPKIIALTGFATRANAARILAAGADRCLSKTASPDLLLQEMGLNHAIKR
jgi:excisionase family DNA binding protein